MLIFIFYFNPLLAHIYLLKAFDFFGTYTNQYETYLGLHFDSINLQRPKKVKNRVEGG